jgi:hypothetical protein
MNAVMRFELEDGSVSHEFAGSLHELGWEREPVETADGFAPGPFIRFTLTFKAQGFQRDGEPWPRRTFLDDPEDAE